VGGVAEEGDAGGPVPAVAGGEGVDVPRHEGAVGVGDEGAQLSSQSSKWARTAALAASVSVSVSVSVKSMPLIHS
jgi:hypothetical protein